MTGRIMFVILYNMKKASVRKVQHRLSEVLRSACSGVKAGVLHSAFLK
ncbi:MAG: hypothetical protein HXY20_05965 [Acidobacteria bacterium]|nr:hypothetical protein [Acidobacteriota bacterium]